MEDGVGGQRGGSEKILAATFSPAFPDTIQPQDTKNVCKRGLIVSIFSGMFTSHDEVFLVLERGLRLNLSPST